jgi:hypothetical protein
MESGTAPGFREAEDNTESPGMISQSQLNLENRKLFPKKKCVKKDRKPEGGLLG